MTEIPVLTVDGPSGSGKGTICARVAAQLGWHLLDSGALYRLVAYGAEQHRIPLDDEEALSQYAASLEVDFVVDGENSSPITRLEGQDVGNAIRSETCGNAASKVAALEKVRAALLQRQRDFQVLPGLVADGRDMGTVVFPAAKAKVYLTASVEERAQRRYKQLIEKGISANLAGLAKEIAERDARDSQRKVAPLKPAADALVIDTTSMSIDDVTEQVIDMCQQAFDL